MRRAKSSAKPSRSPAAVAREAALRKKYQERRPTLAELIESGDYEPPMSQGNYLDLMQILACLRRLRDAAGLSLADMARRTGMDRAALSRLENAVNDNPTLETLSRYVGALGKRLVVKIVDESHRRANGSR